MSLGRAPVISLAVALCLALLGTTLPTAALAQGASVREYIVTLDVQDSNRNIKPTDRAGKARMRQRAKAADEATTAVAKRQGVKVGHRYGYAVTGFSARMTRAQARRMARDPSVSSVRVARQFKVSAQKVPASTKRVRAYQGSPQPDVSANVAVVDTGIGPAFGNGLPRPMTTNELNIAGGINCVKDSVTQTIVEGNWGDVDSHGTHVAGVVGARNNAVGTVGVAPGVALWSVRVLGPVGGSEDGVLCGLDWVIATHTNEIPDIDVVNMSLEGPRYQLPGGGYEEDCAVIQGDLGADPIHRAVCTLRSMGVPVVASAGNSASDANDVAPGGYDQTITVGAMTDSDGKGWERGRNATCSGWSREADDTFASYSNWGDDVDIVAPGTCVWSTWYGDRSGDTLVRMTGTSMAAPHVTGAIARYVDAKGNPSSVAEMRQLIRAGGRLDWDARTDPVWFGVNDVDPPNRVLDVAALTGGPAVTTWVYHRSFTVGGTDDSRTTRVDVQRSGGYDGAVDLSTSGLPGPAGSTAFDASSLEGLGKQDLGTNLVFTLDGPGGEGIHDVNVTANGSGVPAFSRVLELIIDRTPPNVWKLGPKVRGQRSTVTRQGTTKVIMKWNPKDAISGVASAQLQRRIAGGSWQNVASSKTSGVVSMKRGQDNEFRVRATDNAGNQQTGKVVDARLLLRDSKSSALQRSGSWRNRQSSGAYGGSLLIATSGTPKLRTTFQGKAVAILAPVGSGRGTFRVRVDGSSWSRVDARSAKAAHRKVVWSRRLKDGTHTVVIQRLAGRPAIDAVIFVR